MIPIEDKKLTYGYVQDKVRASQTFSERKGQREVWSKEHKKVYIWATASPHLSWSLAGTEDFIDLSLKVRYLILRAVVCFVERQTERKRI